MEVIRIWEQGSVKKGLKRDSAGEMDMLIQVEDLLSGKKEYLGSLKEFCSLLAGERLNKNT